MLSIDLSQSFHLPRSAEASTTTDPSILSTDAIDVNVKNYLHTQPPPPQLIVWSWSAHALELRTRRLSSAYLVQATDVASRPFSPTGYTCSL